MYIPSIPARQLLAARSSMSGTNATGLGVSSLVCYVMLIESI